MDEATPKNPTPFAFPNVHNFPPLYTIQPNITTRGRQFDLWSNLIQAYCRHHRLFKLSLSTTPPDLFKHPSRNCELSQADIRQVLDHMSQPNNGPRIEWIPATGRGEQSNVCYVYWLTPAEWADAIYKWVDETGQKGAVLTLYELREGSEGAGPCEWRDIDEVVLRKSLNVLVKRGKAQVFGQEESAGVKFF